MNLNNLLKREIRAVSFSCHAENKEEKKNLQKTKPERAMQFILINA